MIRLLLILGILLLLVATGCPGPAPPANTGEGVFYRKRCRRCHSLAGKGGGTGPALDTVGTRRGREWLQAYLKEPTSRIPKARMDNPELTDQEIRLLVDYLVGPR